MKRKRLCEILQERGKISAANLEKLFTEQQDKVVRLGELILERGLVEKSALTEALEEISRVPYVDCVGPKPRQFGAARRERRLSHFSELCLSYEGRADSVPIRPPDLSPHGMFVNTSTHFPEGAGINLRFPLTRSNIEVQTNAEVCYCLTGIGIGSGLSESDPMTFTLSRKKLKLPSGFAPERILIDSDLALLNGSSW